MKVLARLLTGGLVGFAVLLIFMGHPAWIAHTAAAAVSVIATILGRRSRWWDAIPFLAVVIIYFTQWWN